MRKTKHLAVVVILLCACTSKPTAQSYIDNGKAFLENNNYEEAIIAFSSAIEIDEKNIEALRGRALSFKKSNQYQLAMADYNTVLDYDSSNQELYDEAISFALANSDISIASELVSKKESTFGIQSFTENDIQIRSANSLLDTLKSAYELSGNESVWSVMKSEEYIKSEQFLRLNKYSLIRNGDSSIGLYYTNAHCVMVFIGNISNFERIGYGSWYYVSNNSDYCAKGVWEKDLPNGLFDIVYNDGHGAAILVGNVIDGLYDGEFKKLEDNDIHYVSYNMGITIIDHVEDGPNGKRYYIGRTSDSNSYNIFEETNPANIVHSIQGITGGRVGWG